jgi:RimJ/RimL family protein N-acetyltransferase
MNLPKAELRKIIENDLDDLEKLLNDQPTQKLVGAKLGQVTRAGVLAWVDEKNKAPNVQLFAVSHNQSFAGYIVVSDINQQSGYATIGISLLADSRGAGLGKMAVRLAHHYCKNKLKLRKLLLHVRCDNRRALNLYLGIGYKQVGVLHKHLKDGENYVDYLIMEVFL